MCIGFVVAVTSSKLGKDGGSSIETLEVEEPESEMLAEEISAEELYIIRTRSNEYILIVDARSKEEFDAAHISGALPLVAVHLSIYV